MKLDATLISVQVLEVSQLVRHQLRIRLNELPKGEYKSNSQNPIVLSNYELLCGLFWSALHTTWAVVIEQGMIPSDELTIHDEVNLILALDHGDLILQ